MVSINEPFEMFQNLMVLSYDPLTRTLLFNIFMANAIEPACPLRVFIKLPSVVFHILMVVSALALAIILDDTVVSPYTELV